MSKINNILNDFRAGKIESFDFQEKIFKLYKKSDKSEEIISEILNVVESTIKDESVRDDMWGLFFAPDRKMHRLVDLISVKSLAEKSLFDNINSPHPVLLKGAATLAYSTSKNSDTGLIDADKEKIWRDVFNIIPEFNSVLDKELKYWVDWHSKLKEEHKNYYTACDELKNKPIVESYQIFIPVKLNDPDLSLWSSSEIDILINEIVSDFNSFQLQGYMNSLGIKCSNSSVEFYNGFLFTFDCNEKIDINDLVKVKEEFLGQLSDGWGANTSQKNILINDKVINIDFITTDIRDFTIIDKSKKLKI